MKQYRTGSSGIRRAGVALAAVILAAVSLTACNSAKDGADSTPSPSSSTPSSSKPSGSTPSAPTPWQQVLGKVKPDGSVDVDTALTAFAMAIAPVPGVTPPAGDRADITSGTIAIRWVTRVWSKLTPAQQAAVSSALGATTPSGGHSIIGPDNAPATAPARPPNFPCLAKDSAKAEPYRGAFNAIVAEMESHLWPLRVRDHVFFSENTSQVTKDGAPAYTAGCAGADDQADRIDGCTIHFDPVGSAHGSDAGFAAQVLVHELTHCFIMSRWGSNAEASMPDWYAEGGPNWVAATLTTGDPTFHGWWDRYLDRQTTPLGGLTYDGMGFFVHLTESGIDAWKAMATIGTALALSPVTPAGWNASGANGNQQFLDTWGSGFAQGRYPGTAWHTGTGNLDQHQPPISRENDLANEGEVPFSSNALASGLLKLNVSAEIVEVEAGGAANGRISLGNGADATLASTAGKTYCTLSAEDCKCPEGSDKADTTVTPMEKGTEYVGLTGGSAAASVNITGQSFEEFCKKAPLVGTWKATSGATIAKAGTGSVKTIGGAGSTMTIGKTGAMTVSYKGMAPASYDVDDPGVPGLHGKATVTGTDTATLDLKAKGVWNPRALSIGTNVVVNITSPGAAQYHGPEGMAQFFGPIYAGTWKITGKTLTVVWQGNNGGFHQHTTWVFTRVR